MTGFDSAFEQVKILVEHFSANEKMYLAADYSEARVRTDFIDKFFTALGWDVNHNVQLNPYEQEVSIEKPVKVDGMQQKRADYAFFLAPNYRKDDVKFYVEAKKPARNLSNVIDYFQTCRYGWSAGTPLAILTDFEEFHILDCRTKPDINTILDTKRDYFHYKDYLDKEKFAKVYWLFSREAVANNSLEKYVEQLPKLRGKGVQKKRGYESIDEVFLEELDE
ncbi:MAG: endonuclease, partial [Ignavibacteria bacterium CG22_combo_CG10-13_8_21_14_all_37_15]